MHDELRVGAYFFLPVWPSMRVSHYGHPNNQEIRLVVRQVETETASQVAAVGPKPFELSIPSPNGINLRPPAPRILLRSERTFTMVINFGSLAFVIAPVTDFTRREQATE